MNDTAPPTHDIVVVGAGMAAQRFVECLLRDPGAGVRVTVIGEEEHWPYDRSSVIGVLSGVDAAALTLDRAVFRDDRVRLIRDDRVLRIDRIGRAVRTRARRAYSYDTLVLATGSFAARVMVEGAGLPGCFVFRTIDDVESVRAFVDSRSQALGRPLHGAVIGGGMHGLEVAVALHGAGVAATVVQFPDRLMPDRLDPIAAGIVQSALEERGISVRTRTRTTRLDPDESGAITALEFQDGSFQRADLVVFTVGVRPRDELARNAGIDVHPRGGVIVDDRCGTSDPDILAIGEVAWAEGGGIETGVAAQAMAEVAAIRVLGGDARFAGQEEFAQYTVAGIDVVGFGDPLAHSAGAVEVVTRHDRSAGVYRKLVLTDDARTLLGGVLVGDTSGHVGLSSSIGVPSSRGLAAQLWTTDGAGDDAGAVCGHIDMSHRELLAAVQAAGLSTFRSIGARFGRDLGCERCTLAIARVLSGPLNVRDPLGRQQAPEDAGGDPPRLGADGTLVVMPVGEEKTLTPAHLVAIGQVAARFGLQPRIIGSRIELGGVRSEEWGAVRAQLIAADLVAVRGIEAERSSPGKNGERTGVLGRGSAEQSAVAPMTTEQSRSGAFATGWGDRGRPGRTLRGSPLRAENPA